MSYEMKYHTHLCKDLKMPTKRKEGRAFAKWLFILLALIFGIGLRSRGFWLDFLIPGDAAITAAAVETFSENLKDGLPFKTAFENFCWEIVDHEAP